MGNGSRFTQFVEVVGDDASTNVFAKYSPTGSELDLSEIVNRHGTPKASLEALFSWAAAKRNRVTLTAADGPLIPIYESYGFVGVNGKATADQLKAKEVKFLMVLSDEARSGYLGSQKSENVFWEFLPDLVGLD